MKNKNITLNKNQVPGFAKIIPLTLPSPLWGEGKGRGVCGAWYLSERSSPITSNEQRATNKGFSLAEVMVISAVFLIVTMISLTIIVNGWKLIKRVETSSAQLRGARETLARVSVFLREANEICLPDDNTLKSGASSIVFTKNNDDLLNPAKEIWEFVFNNNDRTVILKKYDPAYPGKVEIKEEKIVGRDIDSFNFKLVSDQNPDLNLSKLIKISVGVVSKNIKTPDINLSTSIKLKGL